MAQGQPFTSTIDVQAHLNAVEVQRDGLGPASPEDDAAGHDEAQAWQQAAVREEEGCAWGHKQVLKGVARVVRGWQRGGGIQPAGGGGRRAQGVGLAGQHSSSSSRLEIIAGGGGAEQEQQQERCDRAICEWASCASHGGVVLSCSCSCW